MAVGVVVVVGVTVGVAGVVVVVVGVAVVVVGMAAVAAVVVCLVRGFRQYPSKRCPQKHMRWPRGSRARRR